jgi:hypothetical protein
MHSEHVLSVGEEVEVRGYVERPSRIQLGSDDPSFGLQVTCLQVGDRSRIEGMPAAETVNGFPVPGDRMLTVRLRNLGPATRKVRFALIAA